MSTVLLRASGVRFGFAQPLLSEVSFQLEARQIAVALRCGAEVLLLDELTNHLDARSRQWLLRTLPRFAGAGLLVSHDRELLDALTSATLRIAGGTARLYPAPYSQGRLLWEAEEHERREEREAASERERALRKRLGDARRDREAAAEQKTRAPRRRSRRSRSRPKLGGPVFASYQRCPRPFLARSRELSVGRHDRIWLSGPNGAGKTTLLRELLAGVAEAGERVVHLPQAFGAEEARAALEAVRALNPDQRGRVLSLVATLGADPGRLLSSTQPSPGEARKLVLATGLGRNAWALFLDEPTNHLDLPSIERLESVLRTYPGALLLVTHDARLAAACCKRRWEVFPGGTVREAS